jgi:phosphomethylpyrimidine synthase
MIETATSFTKINTPSEYPTSTKQYLQGSRRDLRVPYREIKLSPTAHHDRVEKNLPVPAYDTSGPYTDASVQIDLIRGLNPLRAARIEDRGDSEQLKGLSSAYGRQRQNDLLTADLRFPQFPGRAALSPAKTSARCIMRARASSRRRWNSSLCASR